MNKKPLKILLSIFLLPLLSACMVTGGGAGVSASTSSSTPYSEPYSETSSNTSNNSSSNKEDSVISSENVTSSSEGESQNTSTSTSTSTSDTPATPTYQVSVRAIGATNIKAGNTVTLRADVTPIKKAVTWSSENEAIATVSNRGVVTALAEGQVRIYASVTVEPISKGFIVINVAPADPPTSITIDNIKNNSPQWLGETLNLSVTPTPSTASKMVSWETSNASIASVTNDTITFNQEGNVVLTATSKADESIKTSVNIQVKNGTFSSLMGTASNWDISHQADSTKYVTLSTSNIGTAEQENYNSLYFAHVKGQRYYVEAYFKVDEQTSMAKRWDWGGFGFANGLNDKTGTTFTYAPYSPYHTDGTDNKICVRDRTAGWDEGVARRSQVWGENGLNDGGKTYFNEPHKMSLLRDYNNYYFLIEDKLMWVDCSTKYNGTDTWPSVYSEDYAVTISNFTYSTDDNVIDSKLASDALNENFFVAKSDYVNRNKKDSFSVTSETQENKVAKIRNYGDKVHLSGNFTFECDITLGDVNTYRYQNNSFSGLSVNFAKYDNADEVDSYILGYSHRSQSSSELKARYVMWNYAWPHHISDIETSPSSVDTKYQLTWAESGSLGSISGTKHLKIERVLEGSGQVLKAYLDGSLISFVDIPSGGQGARQNYQGDYIVWLGGEYCQGTYSNIVFHNN